MLKFLLFNNDNTWRANAVTIPPVPLTIGLLLLLWVVRERESSALSAHTTSQHPAISHAEYKRVRKTPKGIV